MTEHKEKPLRKARLYRELLALETDVESRNHLIENMVAQGMDMGPPDFTKAYWGQYPDQFDYGVPFWALSGIVPVLMKKLEIEEYDTSHLSKTVVVRRQKKEWTDEISQEKIEKMNEMCKNGEGIFCDQDRVWYALSYQAMKDAEIPDTIYFLCAEEDEDSEEEAE